MGALPKVLVRASEDGSPPSMDKGVVMQPAARRLFLLLLALSAAGLGGAVEARGEAAAPSIELLQPAAGAKVDPSKNVWLTFRARVTYPPEYVGPRVVVFEDAYDAGFTKNKAVNTVVCAATEPVCEPSYRTNVSGIDPATRVYWRVRIPDTLVSPTQSFVIAGQPAGAAADRDRDGIADARDNCPAVPNRSQVDFEPDGKGDACQPDVKTPRVKAYPGWERRGQRAQFHWRAVDNRPVTIRLTLRWRGRVVLKGSMPNVHARVWGATASTWETKEPIDSRFPVGVYSYCITAADAAGHKASSCARYEIKPR